MYVKLYKQEVKFIAPALKHVKMPFIYLIKMTVVYD